jgi:predicted alpha/beta hydrolase family esterase
MKCVIIHGCPSDKEKSLDPEKRTYDKHWIPWIKKRLSEKNIEVLTPLMPEPWKANYGKWKAEFDKLIVDEDTNLIGHSCGCAFLVRWLGDTKRRINNLILVAPWKIAGTGNADKSFYDYEIDGGIKKRVKKIVIFTSNNEEKDGKKSAKIFHDALGGELIELKNKGHYTLGDMKTEKFPELLEAILI